MQIDNRLAKLTLAITCLFLVHCQTETASTGHDMSAFFGTFKGVSKEVRKGEISERDLTVTIKPWEKTGFNVTWATVIYPANGEPRKSEPSINFYRSSRPGIFASAMKIDVFNQAVPYNPISTDAPPYVWAGLEDQTLTVRAMYIVDGGGFEMHIYKRTLHKKGLLLDFQRLKDGETVTQVSATLARSDP